MTDEKIYEQQHLTTVYHELQAAKKFTKSNWRTQ